MESLLLASISTPTPVHLSVEVMKEGPEDPPQEEVEKAGHGELLPHWGSPPHTPDTEPQCLCPKPTPEVWKFGRRTEGLERPNWMREMGGYLELVIPGFTYSFPKH